MSEPITRTPAVEAERRKSYEDLLEHVNDTTNYRIKQAEILADIKAELRYTQLWQQTHDKRDDDRFSAIERKVGANASSVVILQKDKAMVKGIWKALTIVALVGASIAAAFAFIWDHIAALLTKGAP